MSFLTDIKDLIPYILVVVGVEIFYSHMLQRHAEEVRRLRDEKAALLEILLAFLNHQAGIKQQEKEKSKDEKKD